MRQTGLILMLWIMSLSILGAQNNKDFVYFNQRTYELYLSGNWQDLIDEGQEALRAGFDFFYLRQRIGIAYYELEKYGKAVPHFYAALQWNQEDPLTKEYLYYALLWSGRSAEARIFAASADQTSPLSVSAFASYKWSDQKTVVDAMEVYTAGLSHSLSNRIRLTHSFEYLNQQFVELLEEEVPRPGGNGPPRIITVENRFSIDQRLYRLGGDVQWKKGWQTGFTVQHIWGGHAEGQFNEQAYWLYMGKSFAIAKLELEGGYANFSQQDIFQIGMQVVIYPMANTNAYYQAGVTLKQVGSDRQHWINQRMGVKLSKGLWAEALFDFGEINYYQERKGVIVYNIGDPIRSRVGGNLQYWPTNNILIFLQYQKEQKTYALDLVDYHHQGLVLGTEVNF